MVSLMFSSPQRLVVIAKLELFWQKRTHQFFHGLWKLIDCIFLCESILYTHIYNLVVFFMNSILAFPFSLPSFIKETEVEMESSHLLAYSPGVHRAGLGPAPEPAAGSSIQISHKIPGA